jgi:plasmid stabilization system protein ParE
MRYLVQWSKVAEGELTAAWNAAGDRNAVALASHTLDAALASDPLHFGKPRESSVSRVGFLHPLGVEFYVVEDDERVVVLGVFAV